MKPKCFLVLVVGLPCFWLASSSVPATGGEPFRFPEARCGRSQLRYINGLPVLDVRGTPEEIGHAIGILAVKPAERVLDFPLDLLKHYHAGLMHTPFAAGGKLMYRHFPGEYQQELESMARAAGIDRERLIVGNTLFDLVKLFACSALLVDSDHSATGGPLFARNLDYPTLGYAHEYSLVTIYRPDHARHSFASIGFPGILGCLSGMNDTGLSLAVLEVFQAKLSVKTFDGSGLPYALVYRRILEECSSISEARELLLKTRRTTTNNLAIADRDGIAILEITPHDVRVRNPVSGRCVCTNHFCLPELRPLFLLDFYRTQKRYDTLDKIEFADAHATPADLQKAMHAVYLDGHTMQTMVFEPAALRMHLAIGQCPSSAGKMKILDLAALFDQ